MLTITGLDDFPIALAAFPFPLSDGRIALSVTHGQTPGTSEVAYTAAYLVDGTGRASKVGESERYGKDIACTLVLLGTTLRLIVSEAVPGGGGATARVDAYDFPIGVGSSGASAVDAEARAAVAALRNLLHQA